LVTHTFPELVERDEGMELRARGGGVVVCSEREEASWGLLRGDEFNVCQGRDNGRGGPPLCLKCVGSNNGKTNGLIKKRGGVNILIKIFCDFFVSKEGITPFLH
jgi:hypothetical protein